MEAIKLEHKGKNRVSEDPETLIWWESDGAINAYGTSAGGGGKWWGLFR